MDKHKPECCTDAPSESGCRNNYFDSKRLTTDSFRVEQRYFVDRRHLLNRAVFGWGVVYGFGVSRKGDGLEIKPGLALDECGRELVQVGTRFISLNDLEIEENGDYDEHDRACWLLSAHYAEQWTGSVKVEDSCHCQHEEWERICETVRYSLKRVKCDECCRDWKCELDCHCPTEPCCHEQKDGGEPEYGDNREHAPHGRGGCRCLCDYLTNKLNPNPGHCSVTEIKDPCGHVKADRGHGVPLACIELIRDERGCWTLGRGIDICGPRRLVKRNDLLFDLIRGCDLTRISEIGWKDWHRRKEPVSFDDFSAALGPEGHHEHEYVTELFWVKFSRPVRRDTLRPDVFVMRAMSGEREGGWWMALRAPIVRVETDPDDYVSMATIVVDGAWVEDGVRGRRSLFLGSETWIEIEVRGDFIVDCNGQTVDANALGLSSGPTGNGSPGGTFISTFRVEAAEPYAYATADRDKGASS
jgi:hypothetical protein